MFVKVIRLSLMHWALYLGRPLQVLASSFRASGIRAIAVHPPDCSPLWLHVVLVNTTVYVAGTRSVHARNDNTKMVESESPQRPQCSQHSRLSPFPTGKL